MGAGAGAAVGASSGDGVILGFKKSLLVRRIRLRIASQAALDLRREFDFRCGHRRSERSIDPPGPSD